VEKKGFIAFTLVIGFIGLMVGIIGFSQLWEKPIYFWEIVFFTILIIFSNFVEIPASPYANIAIDTPFYIASVFLLPWTLASLCAFIANTLVEFSVKKRIWENRVFNVANITICTAIVGFIVSYFKKSETFELSLFNFIFFFISAFIFSLLNVFLVLIHASLGEKVKFTQMISVISESPFLSPTLGMSLVGILFAYLVSSSKSFIIPTILVVIPIYLIYLALKRTSELEETLKQTLLSFIKALEDKDPFTADHSRRVAEYSKRIAEKMGLSMRDIYEIEQAALLHDLGKIGVPDEILYKPRKLGFFEWKIVSEHPKKGSELLSHFKSLGNVAHYINHHHERLDGTGYPTGGSGEIPVGSRIIAVADAYDAMRSARPYRAPLSKEEALRELKKGSKRRYDPQIIKLLEEVIKESPDLEKRPAPKCDLPEIRKIIEGMKQKKKKEKE
jgi:HD superfamily phosphohydrolase YqeK